jgi:hypothetical protein
MVAKQSIKLRCSKGIVVILGLLPDIGEYPFSVFCDSYLLSLQLT